jgi:galactokinase
MQEMAIPISDPEIAVIITNSNVKRSLASSAYAERRAQCHSAAKALGKSSLRDANENEVNSNTLIFYDGCLVGCSTLFVTSAHRWLISD